MSGDNKAAHMKILKFSEIEAWKLWRLTRITGSRLKDIVSTKGRKVESYALIAESWIGSAALAEEEESPELAFERGHRLEPEAMDRFRQETGKKVDSSLIGLEREDDSRIAISPDGMIGLLEAVEVKCLYAKRHIEAFITRKIPAEYRYQMLQYFIVGDKLRKLHFVFYHPLFPKGLDYFTIEISRKDIKADIAEYLEYERNELKWVREQVEDLAKYVQSGPAVVPGAAEVIDVTEHVEEIGNAVYSEHPREASARVAAGIKERSYE